MSDRSGPIERQQKRIIVVDDDAAVREMLVRVLVGDGYSALPVADGDEALELMSRAHFDLALLDLGMPDKNGWEVFTELARQHPDLSVIIITAKPHQRAQANAVGAGALLEKPLSFPELLETVERLLLPAN